MTKFEEEFKALTSWEWVNVDLIQQILTKFGNWHSDEEFQIVEEIGGSFALANKNLIDANTKLAEEIANLKSQLQQQALPVVPECVDKWYKFHMGTFSAVITSYASDGADKPVIWLVQNGGMDLLCKMKLYGYTVEKPQLFYLREKNTGYYLRKTGNGVYGITPHYSNDYSEKYMTYKFTQQEIDSIDTGSYEQIEVAE